VTTKVSLEEARNAYAMECVFAEIHAALGKPFWRNPAVFAQYQAARQSRVVNEVEDRDDWVHARLRAWARAIELYRSHGATGDDVAWMLERRRELVRTWD